MRLPSILFIVLLLTAAGCAPDIDDLAIDTEISRVCLRSVAMPFASASDGSATSRFDIADFDLDMDQLAGATVTLENIEMSAGLGIDDFTFADSIHVDLSSRRPSSSTRLVAIDPVGSTHPVRAEGDKTTDLSSYLQNSSTSLEMVVLGEVPATPWAAVLDVCLEIAE